MKRVLPMVLVLTLVLSSFACAAEDTGFTDVSGDAWYADAVAYCQERGWMGGTSDDTFSPNGTMTRAMLATVLYRQEGSPAVTGIDSFTDTADDTWYSAAVVWASGGGIMSGYGNGRFGTDDPVTREQLVTILWRIAGNPETEQGQTFADQDSISTFAVTAVTWARQLNIVGGKSGNRFDPKGNATRAEVATVLMNRDKAAQTEPEPTPTPTPDEAEKAKLEVVVGDTVFTATLADTQAAMEFVQMLPMTITMDDYGGFEKVGSLGRTLTASNSQITTTTGDIVLYNGTNIVMFYGSNSWSYTRLGKIDDLTGWTDALGRGSVSVTFRMAQPPQTTQNKTLVAYFSATGNTRPLAEYAADILGADLYEIVPVEPYTEADLAYYTDCRADREQNDPSARPAISGKTDNMDKYDVVFIGYPIWHGQAPRIISTFLESYDFTGKTIVPFCTSGSSPYSDSTIKPLATEANWITGRRFPAGTTRGTMENWLGTLALD